MRAEMYRTQVPGYESRYSEQFGVFIVPCKGVVLRCLVCAGDAAKENQGDAYAWDHVSVSLHHRCPTWDEMTFIKKMFFEKTETVFQFHPPDADHINRHPFTLHLWRPLLLSIPLPPKEMV